MSDTTAITIDPGAGGQGERHQNPNPGLLWPCSMTRDGMMPSLLDIETGEWKMYWDDMSEYGWRKIGEHYALVNGVEVDDFRWTDVALVLVRAEL